MAANDVDLRAALDTTQERLLDGVGVLTERASEASVAVKHRLDEDPNVQRAVRKAKVTGWSAFGSVIGVMLTLPKLLVRSIGSLSRLADRASDIGEDVAERSVELREKGRDFVDHLPTARQRRRERLRLIGFTSAGVGLGVVIGWVLARWAASASAYDDALYLDDEPWNAVDSDPAANGQVAQSDKSDAESSGANGSDAEGSDTTA